MPAPQRIKHCRICGTEFEARTANHLYCSRRCETRSYRERKGIKMETEGRYCRQCGVHFFPKSNNQRCCSPECAHQSAKEARSAYYRKGEGSRSPEKLREYRENSLRRNGTDGNMRRFLARFPDAPTACEACGESRVLDIAHKPEFRRNGHWRSKDNTTWPDKVWILCPTCHALIDRKGYDPASLGLS